MENEESVNKVYLSSVEGSNRRGRPLGRWKDKVKEYMSERGVRRNGLEWARRESMDRERWRSICHGHSLGDASRGSEVSELLSINQSIALTPCSLRKRPGIPGSTGSGIEL